MKEGDQFEALLVQSQEDLETSWMPGGVRERDELKTLGMLLDR